MGRFWVLLSLIFSLQALAGNGMPHTAPGQPGDPAKATRTVQIKLGDMYFEPASLEVKAGETVRFVISNSGNLQHEFNIGTASMHAEHQKHMQQMADSGMLGAGGMQADMQGMDHSKMGHSGMSHDDMLKMHHDGNSVMVEPGKTAELTWTFAKAAELEFACNVPGHYQAGMVGPLKVLP